MNKKFLIVLVFILTNISLLRTQATNNSLHFDGVNDYVTINSLISPLISSGSFTIEFWMKANYANQTSLRVNLLAINPASSSSSDNKFAIVMGSAAGQTGKLSIYEVNGSPQYLTSSKIVGDNTCHHIAYVRTGTTAVAYVDGVYIGSISAAALNSTDRLSLGQEWDHSVPSDFYNGEMDDLRFYSGARTQSQIQADMNTTLTSNESGLISGYNFDEGVAGGNNSGITSLINIKSTSYYGTLVNFALNGNTSNWVANGCSTTITTTNNVLNFDGIDDYVTIDPLITPLVNSSSFTVEFVMKADVNNNLSFPRVNLFTINLSASSTGENKFAIVMGSESEQTGQLSIYEVNGNPQYLTSSTIVGDNSCHHIAYVRTGITAEAFIDGVSIGTISAEALSTTDRISLGQDWDHSIPTDFYNGEMDDLRIWSSARTQSQIQADMYTTLTGSESGLIAYYDFNQGTAGGNNSSITTLNNLASNQYFGTLVSFALDGDSSNWVEDGCEETSDNSLNFDGINDYVTIDQLITPLINFNSFTIEFWMKADVNNNLAFPRVNFFAINLAAAGPGENKFAIVMGCATGQTGQLSIYEVNGNPQYLTSSTIIGDNTCHHIAYVRTGTTARAYLDGVSIGTISAAALSSTDRISMGQEWDYSVATDFYNGEMNDFRIWSSARTQSQIQADMNTKLTGNEAGLIAIYNFDQGTPGGDNSGVSTLKDLTSNGNDGTLWNFALDGTTSNWVANGCDEDQSISSTQHQMVGNALSEEEITSISNFDNMKLSINPNPFHDYTTIKLDSKNRCVNFELFDIKGVKENVKFTISGNQIEIERGNLSSGIYMFKIIDDQNSIKKGKLVVID
jgi:hypothetical protein